MKADKPDFPDLLMAAAQAGLTEDVKNALYLQALATRPDDLRLRRSVEARIQRAAMAQSRNPALFPTPSAMVGDFMLGRHPDGEARIPFPALTSHLLQVGGSGAGKTCNFFFWLHQALGLSAGVWVFDFFKREFRDLAAGRDLHVLRWHDFPFNPLEAPKGVRPAEWANTVSDLFTATLAVPPVARNVLRSALVGLYRTRGVEAGSEEYPTLRELADAIRQSKAHQAACQAIVGRIEALLDIAGDTLSHRRGLPLAALERTRCVFELDGLGLIYQNFLAACLLAGAFSRRVATSDNGSPLLVSLDEGQRLYSRSAAASVEGPSFITLMTSLVRATGIMLLVGVQTTDDLSRTILSNSATKVLGRCGDLEDYGRMGRSMGLSAQQIAWCQVSLQPGRFVAQLTYGDHQYPFLLQTPLVKPARRVTDPEVAASGQALRQALGWKPEAPQVVVTAGINNSLSADERRFFDAVLADPYRPSSRIAPDLGVSQRKALKLRNALCAGGWLREWKIDSGQRGSVTLLVPLRTSDGAEVGQADGQGRGGPLHRFALGCIETALAAEGWRTEREVGFQAGAEKTYVDLVARRDGEPPRFIEFELRPDYAATNIRKALLAGAERIDTVTATRNVARAIGKTVATELLPAEYARLRISMLSDFMTVS